MLRKFRTSTTSRERNRVHAKRTRQRKKEQMQGLKGRVYLLKQEQIRLKQVINDKITANILVGLFARNSSDNVNPAHDSSEDPRIDVLLRRPAEEIPDASMIPELPALILPGQHASKKLQVPGFVDCDQDNSEETIDFELLSRDRSQCTPEELDKIRRERNRMHAKRTRDRKRLFTERLADMSRMLQEENDVLKQHLVSIDPFYSFEEFHIKNVAVISAEDSSCSTSIEDSPMLAPMCGERSELIGIDVGSPYTILPDASTSSVKGRSTSDSLSTLLQAAGCFELNLLAA